ncbi:Crp/Fnr family transcriptional regulator [uncultured Meiothermus sp.]|jgi:CRP-like cAMP-binding protein|uniref:Crp/Fnr family transcriptional regulator n=1 Tax=uncultured Meiothermus sp. TaxID=157471 RepID=UPI00260838AD|nr:Crp/Fnr family transcriptional regulator [uncultured Meiothermus sp.]
MSKTSLEHYLAEHPFFHGLRPKDIEWLAGLAQPLAYEVGDYLYHEGDESRDFYVIQEGLVRLEVHTPGRGYLTIQTLGPGEVLGWSVMMPETRKTFDARIFQATRLLAFDAAAVRKRSEEDHHLGYELCKRFSRVIGERLQATRLRLLDLYGQPH